MAAKSYRDTLPAREDRCITAKSVARTARRLVRMRCLAEAAAACTAVSCSTCPITRHIKSPPAVPTWSEPQRQYLYLCTSKSSTFVTVSKTWTRSLRASRAAHISRAASCTAFPSASSACYTSRIQYTSSIGLAFSIRHQWPRIQYTSSIVNRQQYVAGRARSLTRIAGRAHSLTRITLF